MSKKIVIIGGGPAGVESAITSQQTGTNMTIISDGPIGGRAGWHSLLPSKVWLSAVDSNVVAGDTLNVSDQHYRPNMSPESVVQCIQSKTELEPKTDLHPRKRGSGYDPGYGIFH